MNQQTHMRKLAGILYADVKDYSRMMSEDESFTISSLTKRRKLFTKEARNFKGRIVNAPGDSILAEFSSVVDAVDCAARIQNQIRIENSSLSKDKKMEFRIGINLGDVIQKDKDIFGDGVNIAARVEALAPVGGICITRSVFDQVKGVLSQFKYHYTGEHSVKNINEPVRVYEVLVDKESVETVADGAMLEPVPGVDSQGTSIAVFPFENFSGEQINDYFSRGFVEDLITDLSHFNNLQVISSYTSRKIGSQGQDEIKTSKDIGIDYLLKGNLIRRQDTIRINTQLIDTENGSLLWADKYDAPVDTIFEIQDDIVQRVAGAISFQIDKVLLAAARKKPATSLVAYDFWLQGMELLRKGTKAADEDARKIFKKALVVDPHYSRAYTGISLSHFNEWSCQQLDDVCEIGGSAYKYAMRAAALDDTDHVTQMVIGRILMYRREFDLAEQHIDKSLALNSNDADNLVKLASCKALLGKPEEGEQLFKKSLKLNPYRNFWYYTYGAITYFVQQKYETCIETALKGPLTEEWIDLPAYIAASYAHLGEKEKADHYLNIFFEAFKNKIADGHTPDSDRIINWIRIANPFRYEAHIDHYVDGLLKAGLSDGTNRSKQISSAFSRKLKESDANVFKHENKLWLISFEGVNIQIPEVKGFYDIAQLFAKQGSDIHCRELMGTVTSFNEEEPILDEKAKRAYQQRLNDLREDILEADRHNDIGRSEKLKSELDQLTDHLGRMFGLSNRTRKINSTVERARAAVTWRIRSAISKIKAAHPSLGRHLTNSITTGTYCSYSPEKNHTWHL